MDKKRILYIGEKTTHNEFLKGNVPSHWFYGAVEMEKDGHEVLWCQETHSIYNDLRLIKSHCHDMIFIPNLNLRSHFVLLYLAALRIYRKPIYAYIHRAPSIKKGIKNSLYKLLLRGLSHAFFLSEKSMQETVNAGLLKKERCSVPEWGPDMAFFSKIPTTDNGVFVSTGKENRDFEILVEAFRRSGAPLRIFTVPSNYTSHYEYLQEKCKDIPNIEVYIVENTSANYPIMIREMAQAKALVCPLRRDRLTYCVGLSTIADAEGLRKPLLITRNPYHNTDRISECGGFQVTTVEEWTDAIAQLSETPDVSPSHSMAAAYSRMKSIMKL